MRPLFTFMPSLLASLSTSPVGNLEEFRQAAKLFEFTTALTGAPIRPYEAAWEWPSFEVVLTAFARFSLFFQRSRQIFNRR